jgi:hypothetical protein
MIMVERRIYHVMRRQDHSWQVLKEGFKRPHVVRPNKEEAILLAKRLARVSPQAKVVIHNDADNVEGEFHYHFEAA